MRDQRGFVLIEVILASALLLLMVVGLGGALLYAQESATLAGNRTRAVFLADEGLEAVRNLRDDNYDSLVDGAYGLADTGGEWSLLTDPDTSGVFVRTITITEVVPGIKQIASEVVWPQNGRRDGDVVLVTRLSAWTVPLPPPAP